MLFFIVMALCTLVVGFRTFLAVVLFFIVFCFLM